MPATRLPARIWPRTPSPLGPSRSGSLYRPAARMIGVASRNAKRAASSWSRPRASPATMVTPERLMPAKKARIWVAPISSASRKARVESSREGGSPVRVEPVMGWVGGIGWLPLAVPRWAGFVLASHLHNLRQDPAAVGELAELADQINGLGEHLRHYRVRQRLLGHLGVGVQLAEGLA